MEEIRCGGGRLMLYLCIAPLFLLLHSSSASAGAPSVDPNALMKMILDMVRPLDDSPDDSLPPMPLPLNAPPFCLYPPPPGAPSSTYSPPYPTPAIQPPAPPSGGGGGLIPSPPQSSGGGGFSPTPPEYNPPSAGGSGGGGFNPSPPENYPPSSGGGFNPIPPEYNPPSGGGSSGGGGFNPIPPEYNPPSGGGSSGGGGFNPGPPEYNPPSGGGSSGGGGFNPGPPEYNPPSGGGSSGGGGFNPGPPEYNPPSGGGSSGGGGFNPSPPSGGGGTPVFLPPIVYPAPAVPPPPYTGPKQALWCVVKPSVPEPIIQEALNYACASGAECSEILDGGACFQPNTVAAHASYAFNSFWQRNKVAGGTCGFGGVAIIVSVDPSYGTCHFIYV